VQSSPANLVLASIKKAEDSEAWVVQCYETQGDDSQATLTFPQPPKRVVTSDFLEEDGTPLDFNQNVVRVNAKANSVVTVKVYF
jgi:alpha-mannosidase